MISGYSTFPEDVQSVFTDCIQKFGFELTLAEPDAVILENNKVQIAFSINEETLNMSVKSGDNYYSVPDIMILIDRDFYMKWETEREKISRHLGREEYYQTYLQYYLRLSDKYLLNTYENGSIPMQNEYDKMNEEREANEKRFSMAWEAVNKLDHDNPIKKKYDSGDQSWLEDMINLMENGR